MKYPLKVTRHKAEKILRQWNNGKNPHRRVVCAYKGDWFDLRGLIDPVEVDLFLEKITGRKVTPQSSVNINFRPGENIDI